MTRIFPNRALTPVLTPALTVVLAAATALALTAPPARALGKNEKAVLVGVAAALVLGAIVNETVDKPRAAAQARPYPPAQPYAAAPAATPGAAAETAFESYSTASRLAIQRELAAFGYYHGAIDGIWGPQTEAAVALYARATGMASLLATSAGAFQVYERLLA